MRIAFLLEDGIYSPAYHRRCAATAILRETGADLFLTGDNYGAATLRLAERQREYDFVVVMLFSQKLFRAPDCLRPIEQPVIFIEHDACRNYLPGDEDYGKWSAFFARQRVDTVCASGWNVKQRLEAEGNRCLYLPKGTPAWLLDAPLTGGRGFCAFGSLYYPRYPERAKLMERITRKSWVHRALTKLRQKRAAARWETLYRRDAVGVQWVQFKFGQMPAALAPFAGSVICDRGLREVMAKHFEVSSVGKVVLRDQECIAELDSLGYHDGESMLTYHDARDLNDKLLFYHRCPQALRPIQAGAREAARRNTWEERARTLLAYLRGR